MTFFFFFSSRRRHTRCGRDWSSDVCSSDLLFMKGFIKSYATQGTSLAASRAIMSYFPPEKLPVLTRLATEYAVFNGWFSSIPGPTICNRAFAHYGTSFGNVDMNLFYIQDPIQSIYERMLQARHTAKIYYYDQQSSTMEIVNLLKNQPQIFGQLQPIHRRLQEQHPPRVLLYRALLQRSSGG